MTERFNAMVIDMVDEKYQASIKQITEQDLSDEDVLVAVDYSTLNYKDGLVITGAMPFCQSFPMICGIDLAGTVLESRDSNFKAGDRVLVNGYGLSERHHGGYAQKQRLKAEWLVRIPERFSTEHSMALGTAGYTSMLCVLAIIDHGVKPEHGPILVTGAAGGVGSIAISLLSKLGYQVTASTGRVEACRDFLTNLGASDLLARDELARQCKPLEAETWAAVVDTVGDKVLATAIAQTKYNGVVAACGLAGGAAMTGTVLPFILRNVALKGVDSVMAPQAIRQRAWNELAKLIDLEQLASVYTIEPMTKLPELAQDILAGKIKGRVVIDVNS